MEQKTVTDSILVTSLLTTPAWVPWLEHVNMLLTTLTLVVGFALGVGRLVAFLRERK